MIENRYEIEIQATAEQVWNVLIDLDGYTDWNPSLYQASGRIAYGQQIELSSRTASNDINLTCTVSRVDPKRELAWTYHVGAPFLFRGEHSFQIIPIDGQKVHFIDREVFHGVMVIFQAKDLLTNAKHAMIAMGETLKRRVEK